MINLDSSIKNYSSYREIKDVFTEPYAIGCCLINKAFSLVNNEGYSLKNRVSCIVLSLSFLIPLINVITYVSIQYFFPEILTELMSNNLLVDLLDEWVASGSVMEDRMEARKRILEYNYKKEYKSDSHSALNELSLQSLHLRSLPEIFHIKHFTKLQILDLRNNSLQSLPDTIGNLSELQILNLNRNELQSLPDTIGSLSKLKYFLLEKNQLSALPSTIGHLSNLQVISLQNNKLSGLPNSFFLLKSLRECNLVNNLISHADRQEILRVVRRRFHISIVSGESNHQIHFEQYEHCITEICDKAKVNREKFLEVLLLDNAMQGNFLQFINKLEISPMYIGEKNKTTAQLLLQCLHLSYENQEFSGVMSAILEEGSTSCSDRATLSMNKLYLQYCLYTEFPKGMNPVDFVVGLKRMELLEVEAAKFAKSYNRYEAIEVYLALEVRLKNKLNLPSLADELTFFDCSHLTQVDLDEKEQLIRSKTQDAFQILTDPNSTVSSIWNDYVEKKYQKEIKAITDQYDYSDPENLPSYDDEAKMKQRITELKQDITWKLIRQRSIN